MLETYEYPSGYKLKYLYDSRGNQHEVRTADAANTLLWKANAENQRGQLTQATMGNGTITDYEWDTYGFPQRNKVSKGTSSILQNLTFSFNSVTGNLNARSDAKRNILETFGYDNLLKDRLTYWSATGGAAKTMTYEANGNILKKTDVSTANTGYIYEGPKPHAVTKVVSPTAAFIEQNQLQNITYTPFNKIESISQPGFGSYVRLDFTYGPDNERRKTFLYKTSSPVTPYETRYYFDDFEVRELYHKSLTEKIHYLYGPDGMFGICMFDGGYQEIYFIHKDYLGSLTAISDATGNLVESLSYDPWGRRRNADDWNDYNVTSTLFDRGFTGHEHLPQFGLINMNGRVYDPFLARFLSPDPFVQAPDYSQNFNRYSYCVNNPLKYTDPSGEIFGTVFTFLWDLGATIFTKGGIDPWNTSENRREAWMEFDPTAPWSKTNKALKIDQGLGKTDPNRNEVEKLLQFFSRFTWELPQTLLGNVISHTRNVSGRVENVDYYGGATLVNMKDNSGDRWGFSLGPYINSKNVKADPNLDPLFRHEYGHTLQSQLVGPYYLSHVALPSLIGQGLDDIGWADHKREWYETQANRMSERYFRNRDPNALTALPWDDTRYPREYKPNWYWIFAHPPVPFLWLLLY